MRPMLAIYLHSWG